MSDKPSNSLGGMISSLFGRRNSDDNTRSGGLSTRTVVGGALLAAGASYLYKRYKGGNLNIPGSTTK